MDVEKRTTITAGMNAEPMKQGLRDIATEAAKTTSSITQSSAAMGRALLDASRGFDSLARKWVDGYRDALNYAQAFQTVSRAVVDGRDKLGLIPTILGNIEQKFGLVSTAARTAAATMADSTKPAEERLKALQALIAQFQQQAQQAAARGPDLSGLQVLGDTARRARIAADPMEQRMAAQRAAEVQATVNRFAGVAAPQSGAAAESAAVFTAELDKQRAAIDPLFRASKQYEAGLNAITEAVDNYVISAERGAALQEQLTASFAKANQPIVAQAQSYDELRASIDPVYQASKAYEQELNTIQAVAAKLNLTTAQTDVLTEQATARFAAANAPLGGHIQTLNHLTGATGQQSFAMRQLAVQAVQTFQGFATGQPIIMTLIQQGHQVADVMLSAGVSVRSLASAVGNALSSFTAFLLRNPFILIVAGITALIAALGALAYEAESTDRRLKALENSARGVRDNFGPMAAEAEAAAHHLAQTTALSFQDAFAATSVLAKTPQFEGTQAQMENIVKLAQQMSLVFGGDLASNVELLAKGMKNAGEIAQQLMDTNHLKGVDQVWVDMVKNMASRDPVKAFEMLAAAIQNATKGATENVTNLQREWQKFTELLTGKGEGFWHTVGQNIADGLSVILHTINAMIEAWQNFSNLIGSGRAAQTLREMQQEATGQPGTPGSGVQLRLPTNVAAGMQANNPLNLMVPSSGVVPPGVGTMRLDENRVLQTFKTMEEGVAAAIKQLQESYQDRGLKTVEQMVSMWEYGGKKPGDAAYIAAIQKAIGVQPGAEINIRDAATAAAWIRAAQPQESGPTRLTEDQIAAGVRLATGGAATSTSGAVAPAADATTAAQKASADTLIARGQEIQRKLDEQRRGLEAAQQQAAVQLATGNITGYAQSLVTIQRFGEEIRKLTSDMTNNISEQDKQRRSLEDANRPLAAAAGAARDLATEEERFREIARDTNGGIVDQTALTGALNAVRARHLAELKDTIAALDYETNAQNALTTSTELGGKALEHSANYEKAVIDAYKFGAQGTKEYAAAVIALTEAYDRNSEAKRTNQAAADIHGYAQENEQLELQAKLIGASTDEINRQTAILQERQKLGLSAGETPNAEQQRAIDAAKQTADLKTEIDKQKAAYQELETFGTSVFDSIGNAIEASFQKGADAAQVWKDAVSNIMNSVIKEFLKLAVINPLLNSLFGGGRTTLEDVGNVAGKLGGGDKSTTGGSDVGSKLLNSVTGGATGLPIDPTVNAMRVVNVGGGLGGTGSGVPGVPGTGTGDGGTGGGDGSAGSINQFISNLRAQDQGVDSSSASGASGSSGSSGGGLFSSIFSGVGNILKNILNPGKMLDSVFGKGFFEGGGLLGSIFGGGGGGGGGSSIGAADNIGSTTTDLSGGALTTGLYHSGGLVGMASSYRLMPPGMFDLAPHYQSGLGANEFAAVLHRSERVLTANQNDRLESVMNRVASGDTGGRGGPGGGNVVFNIHTPDADSFKNSQSQISSRMVAGLNRAQQRNRT